MSARAGRAGAMEPAMVSARPKYQIFVARPVPASERKSCLSGFGIDTNGFAVFMGRLQ
jgi:hypothetical protein